MFNAASLDQAASRSRMSAMSAREWIAESLRDSLAIVLTLTIIAMPVAVLLHHVHKQYQITALGYDIAQVTREHRLLVETNKKLKVEAAVQGRTERMTQLASDRFGLAPARPE